MTDTTNVATQVAHPWKATVRTIFAAVVAAAVIIPTLGTLLPSVPAVAIAIAVAGVITRILALPSVDSFLAKYVPFLSTGSVGPEEKKILAFLEEILGIVKDVKPIVDPTSTTTTTEGDVQK